MKKVALAGVLLFACPSFAQMEGLDDIVFASTEVAPGIFMTVGTDPDGPFGGGNLGIIVTDDYVAVVDDSLPPPAPTLVKHIADTAGRPVDFVVNTHHHGDHAGGNALLADAGAVVFAHHNLRERLLADPASAGGPAGIPVITFDDGVTFHLNDVEAQVIHLPTAHTDGDAIVVIENPNVIIVGDVQFNGVFPFIDLNSGGSVDGFIAAQQRIAELADDNTVIIPGHGPAATRTDLLRDTAMLIEGQKRVKKLVDQGLSEDDAVAANPLADYAESFDWAFINAERMTRTFYKDLTAN